jgi:succinate-semialdehyde dehydrogenase/glutarate-semialdehyde dehydrogenase
MMIDHA